MCAHLHWDHVGWNTQLIDGSRVPTFPNAKHIISRTEYDYWDAAYRRGDPSIHCTSFEDSVLPLKKAEQIVLVDDDDRFDDGISLEPCFGHSAGHVVINIADGGIHGVVTGDVIHHQIQLRFPSMSTKADTDPNLARAHRPRRKARRERLLIAAGAFSNADHRKNRAGAAGLPLRARRLTSAGPRRIAGPSSH
jgi:glyoxylase-like metal-dependent hydrolase (beta-lactamase superfamily II)